MNVLPAVPLARLRAALEAAGSPPRRRHGQHFLVDHNLLALIAREGGAGPGDTVLEIGPGPGLLTRHLLAAGAGVVAIEIDPRVRGAAEALVEPELWARLEWVEADALDGPRALSAAVLERLPRCTQLVSNLPYNISVPLLLNLLIQPGGPRRLVATIQKEVGDRLLAGPGGRDYGPVSVIAALCAGRRLVRRIGPQAFWPRPRVDSALVALDRRPRRPQSLEFGELQAFMPLAFHARRKRLPNSVALATGRGAEEVARLLGLGENLRTWRAEAFSPLQLCALAHRWASHARAGDTAPDS
jgi:16S rRNA (adenine1518-N6/adenine1519-N6)-dimethyltransferase